MNSHHPCRFRHEGYRTRLTGYLLHFVFYQKAENALISDHMISTNFCSSWQPHKLLPAGTWFKWPHRFPQNNSFCWHFVSYQSYIHLFRLAHMAGELTIPEPSRWPNSVYLPLAPHQSPSWCQLLPKYRYYHLISCIAVGSRNLAQWGAHRVRSQSHSPKRTYKEQNSENGVFLIC